MISWVNNSFGPHERHGWHGSYHSHWGGGYGFGSIASFTTGCILGGLLARRRGGCRYNYWERGNCNGYNYRYRSFYNDCSPYYGGLNYRNGIIGNCYDYDLCTPHYYGANPFRGGNYGLGCSGGGLFSNDLESPITINCDTLYLITDSRDLAGAAN